MAIKNWFITPKQKFYAVVLSVMTLAFLALTIMSYGGGTEVLNKTYTEAQMEKEEATEAQLGKFSLDQREVCKLDIDGLSLDQSWLWAKVLILDSKSRPVYDYSFNLSHYHGVEGGESWSEGSKNDHKIFVLPKGDYKVLVYAEDEPTRKGVRRAISNGYNTIDRNERVQIIVTKNVHLTRYYVTLFIIFFLLTCTYFYIRSERAEYETPGYNAYSAAYTPDPVYSGPQAGGYDPNQPYDPSQPYNPNQNPPT